MPFSTSRSSRVQAMFRSQPEPACRSAWKRIGAVCGSWRSPTWTPAPLWPVSPPQPAPRAGRPRQLAGGAALHTALLQSQADRPARPHLTGHAHPGAPGPHAAVLNHEGRTGPAATQATIGHQRHAPGPVELRGTRAKAELRRTTAVRSASATTDVRALGSGSSP